MKRFYLSLFLMVWYRIECPYYKVLYNSFTIPYIRSSFWSHRNSAISVRLCCANVTPKTCLHCIFFAYTHTLLVCVILSLNRLTILPRNGTSSLFLRGAVDVCKEPVTISVKNRAVKIEGGVTSVETRDKLLAE